MNRILMCASIVVCSLTGSSRAEPVLIASFGGHVGSGSTSIEDPRVQMGITVKARSDPPGHIPLEKFIFSDVFLSDGESGVFDFPVGKSEPLASIATLLTNGTNDFLGLISVWAGPQYVGIRGDYEWFYLGHYDSGHQVPDLVGYELDFIRLTMRDVEIESYEILGKHGYLATFDYTYEFYGTPIPEPATLGYVILCALAVGARTVPTALSRRPMHGGNYDE